MQKAVSTLVVAAGLVGCFGLWGCAASDPPPTRPQAKRYEAPDERVLFFGPASAELRNYEGFFALGYVSALLDTDRTLHVLVIGHANRQGGDGANLEEMAWRRARTVREKLIAHGIDAGRILLGVPRAPRSQLAPNLARRVEVFVYDPVQDEASQRLGYEVELRKE